MLNLLLSLISLLGTERGPWLLIGRIPDRNPYTCSASADGIYVGPAASITDDSCAVWTLGSGTTPEIFILRNGSPATPVAKGSVIEWYGGVVYVKGTDGATWYSWDDALGDFNTYGTSDPSGGGAVPTGYFVSKTGSDSNSCMQSQTLATARLTIVAGLMCVSAGSTLYVRNGDYDELINTAPSGTSWANKVRITNYPGDTSVWVKPTTTSGGGHVVWLDCNCSYIEFDGINVDGTLSANSGFWVSNNNGNTPHHIRIQNAICYAGATGAGACIDLGAHQPYLPQGDNEVINMTIHGGGLPECGSFTCANFGVYMKSPNNLVENNDIYDTAGAGIQVYSNGAGNLVSGNVIRGNHIHDITRAGSLDEVWGIISINANTLIYNNVINGIAVGNVNSGLAAIAATGTGGRIFNNTIYNNRNQGIVLNASTVSFAVQNNIIYLSTGTNYSPGASTGTTASNNLIGTDPVFVNAGAGNLRLQSSSPARDTGTPLVSYFTTDLEAIPRPQGPSWDIGAYEYH